MIRKIYLVPHTHWDREWYLTFGEYRTYLVRVLDNVLKALGEYLDFFLMDGQTSAVMDYLAVNPDKEDVLKKFVSSRKLGVGPWYTQPDEFLVSGESLIRNLLFGLKFCRKLGKCFNIGYLPDIFGHTPQLPQILNGFGIDTFLFSRGYDGYLGCDFIWEAPDGSKVFSRYLPDGYCHGEMLGVKNKRLDDLALTLGPYDLFFPYFSMYFFESEVDLKAAVKKVEGIVKRYEKCSSLESVVIMNGCDHLPLQPRIETLKSELEKKYEVEIGGLEEFFDELKKKSAELKVYRGELRMVKHRPILTEVLSTRIYLKQMNFTAEKLLTMYLEPLSLIVEELGLSEYPKNLLDELWIELLKNHAHDSICGTSIDEVHVENEARFNHVIRVTNSEIISRLEIIGNNTTEEPPKITLFNPNPWETTGPVEFYAPVEHAGRFAVNEEESKEIIWLENIELEGRKFRKGVFVAGEIQGINYTTYKLSKKGEKERREWIRDLTFNSGDYTFEIDVKNGGRLIVKDGKGELIGEFNIIEDDGDVGDEYNYDPPNKNLVISTENIEARIIEKKHNDDLAIVKIELEMELPSKTTREGRSDEAVKTKLTITYKIIRELGRVDIEIETENRAENHRMRVKNRVYIPAERVFEELHFYENEREIPEKEPKKKPWEIEVKPRVHPHHDYIYVKSVNEGLMIATRGLYEYNALKKDKATDIYITLFRSIGYLSKGDLKSRRGHAGPGIPTPGAQCKRKMKFQYSIIPFKNKWEAVKKAKNFTQPIIAVYSTKKGKLPTGMTWLSIKGEDIAYTAFKKAENCNEKILRIANLKSTINPIRINGIRIVGEINLAEETTLKLQRGGEIFELKPHRIHTFIAI